jgi:hypothetical protein
MVLCSPDAMPITRHIKQPCDEADLDVHVLPSSVTKRFAASQTMGRILARGVIRPGESEKSRLRRSADRPLAWRGDIGEALKKLLQIFAIVLLTYRRNVFP